MLENFQYLCTMDTKMKTQLKQFEELGINIHRHDYYTCVDILIEKYLGVCDALEYDEQERFRKELQRIKNPTN